MNEITENTRFTYEFGNFILDPQEKTLFADGKPIHLPAKQFETLVVLVENNGRALSKEEMLQKVWQDTFVEENNLAKYVSHLRKLLNTNGQKYIETLPKHGYRFSAEVNQIFQSADETILEKRTVKRLTVKIEDEIEETSLALPQPSRKFLNLTRLVISGLIILVVGLAVWFWRGETKPAKISSIAVLPLKSLTAEESNKALGLGLTDALITKLGSLRQIIVRPTSAVVTFANAQEDSIEIGRKLKTDAVLEGTIQQSEGRIRINARLLKVESGEQLWTEKFDEPDNGIFALQDALSHKIVQTLAFELNKTELEQLTLRPTESAVAYEKYLRGRFYQSQNTDEGLTKALEFYEQAIALDPNFADAHAGLADANLILFNFALRPANEVMPKAKQSVNRALQLNPNLASAYNSLALIQFLSEHNWHAAEKSLQRAIELNPNNGDAYQRYGYFLIYVGEFDEALGKLEKARELKPLSPIVQTNIGLAYLCARRFPQAIEQLEKVIAENPDFPFPYWLLGASYEDSGDDEKAFAAHLRGMETEGNSELANRLKNVREISGLPAANQLWLEDLLKAQKNGNISALTIASRFAMMKNTDQTIFWLEKAHEEGDPTLWQIIFLAKYDFIRDNEKFQRILQKIEYKK